MAGLLLAACGPGILGDGGSGGGTDGGTGSDDTVGGSGEAGGPVTGLPPATTFSPMDSAGETSGADDPGADTTASSGGDLPDEPPPDDGANDPGVCGFAPNDPRCGACLDEACCDEVAACAADEACDCILTCFGAGRTSIATCVGECAVAIPDPIGPLVDCMAAQCSVCL